MVQDKGELIADVASTHKTTSTFRKPHRRSYGLGLEVNIHGQNLVNIFKRTREVAMTVVIQMSDRSFALKKSKVPNFSTLLFSQTDLLTAEVVGGQPHR